jgi:hypothetical protein
VKILPNGIEVFVFPPEYYLAAKFVAHKGRGGNDLRQSHDFEDIIYLLDNPNITEGIETALRYGSGEESGDILGMLIREIAEIE